MAARPPHQEVIQFAYRYVHKSARLVHPDSTAGPGACEHGGVPVGRPQGINPRIFIELAPNARVNAYAARSAATDPQVSHPSPHPLETCPKTNPRCALKAFEIRALAERGATVVLPVASVEQHGPALPVNVNLRYPPPPPRHHLWLWPAPLLQLHKLVEIPL